ncbi:hypothetical protein NC651_023404 [Populus alba x Populus x berolinensis]|nr:hypothetical protein NC651_023404 [Populus alba x Populus x berolinensis]
MVQEPKILENGLIDNLKDDRLEGGAHPIWIRVFGRFRKRRFLNRKTYTKITHAILNLQLPDSCSGQGGTQLKRRRVERSRKLSA